MTVSMSVATRHRPKERRREAMSTSRSGMNGFLWRRSNTIVYLHLGVAGIDELQSDRVANRRVAPRPVASRHALRTRS